MSNRSIHCTIVKGPSGQDASSSQYQEVGADLLPWADPYIAQLVQSLRDSGPQDGGSEDLVERRSSRSGMCRLEARPPFDARFFAANRFRRLRRW